MKITKQPKIKKYCKYCGSKLVETESGFFDEYTGKNLKAVCSNLRCKGRCDFFGHNNGKGRMYSDICKICGEDLNPHPFEGSGMD